MTNWDREFIGYFYGEGCITIQKCLAKETRPYYRIKLQFSARQDDDLILQQAKARYGGYIYQYGRRTQKLTGYVAKPVTTWVLDDEWKVETLIKILNKGILPSKKKEQLLLCKRFFQIKRRIRDKENKRVKRYTDKDLADFAEVKEALHRLKDFKEK